MEEINNTYDFIEELKPFVFTGGSVHQFVMNLQTLEDAISLYNEFKSHILAYSIYGNNIDDKIYFGFKSELEQFEVEEIIYNSRIVVNDLRKEF